MEAISIIVAGGVNVDTTYFVTEFPRKGESVSASGRKKSLGGKGLNQAVAARRAGASVALVGATGVGTAGIAIREFLANEGIDTSLLAELPEAETGRAIICVDRDANNFIIIDMGANLMTDPSVVEQLSDTWRSVQFVVANGEAPDNLVESLFVAAKRHGVRTVWNPSPMPSDPSVILRYTDVLVVNQPEANRLSGKSGNVKSSIDELARLGPSEIVLTLGADGCAIYIDGESNRVTAPLVDVVDPTAAGDTFLGYYIADRSQGVTSRNAANVATIAASKCVQAHGAVSAIPRRIDIAEDIRRLNRSNDGQSTFTPTERLKPL